MGVIARHVDPLDFNLEGRALSEFDKLETRYITARMLCRLPIADMIRGILVAVHQLLC